MEADALSHILCNHDEETGIDNFIVKAIMNAGIGGNSAIIEAYAGSIVLDYQEEIKPISTGKESGREQTS